MEERLVIGLTGSFGSGCTTLAKILSKHSFDYISLTSILNKVALSRGKDPSVLPKKDRRKLLQDIGNELRLKDQGFLIKEALKLVKDDGKDIVISCIKNPGEIKELKKIPNAYIIALDTSFEERQKRILIPEYEGDLNQFIKDNDREGDERIKHGQRLQECVDLADVLINNEEFNHAPKNWDDFEDRIKKDFIQLLKSPGYREPTDLELWMHVAYSISLQSKCLKRQVGAIILKGGHVVAAGKNDVAQDEEPCRDYYKECYRDKLRNQIKHCALCGQKLDEDLRCKNRNCQYNEINLMKLLDKCRSLHAEENAILQASKLGGIGLQGGRLFTTTFPCSLCANKIVNVGIEEVVYVESYPDRDSYNFLQRHPKIILTKFEGVKAAGFYHLFKDKNY